MSAEPRDYGEPFPVARARAMARSKHASPALRALLEEYDRLVERHDPIRRELLATSRAARDRDANRQLDP